MADRFDCACAMFRRPRFLRGRLALRLPQAAAFFLPGGNSLAPINAAAANTISAAP
ncbi:hypothetical protein SAMN04488135_101282 [Pollutimonas bauzanensis]|uniref:Uncharacterized protein n=1 Tax=Pollutimonas bauzanensis TaxID=658167 RepID=A0A1M5MPR4_9BURK|nr:hypothetical protein SAMN04488135_101282 [Pollutimonas bauzanensis]